MKTNHVILLSHHEITRLFPHKDAVRVVERAFHDFAIGKMRMPSKTYLDLPEFNGDFRAMPAFTASGNFAGIKWVNSHTDNRKKGLPSVMALYVLNDAKSALPLAILDATELTGIRTGAAGGVAARLLSRKESSIAAMVGCGAQAIHQLKSLLAVRRIRTVRLYDPSKKSIAAFIEQAGSFFHGQLEVATDVDQCVSGADIVTTTTPSHLPVVRAAAISPGTHINAIGADAAGKQELEITLLKKSRIFVDEIGQAAHSGEINVGLSTKQLKLSQVSGSLCDVVAGKIPGRTNTQDITIFDSTGLAIQDLASAIHIYRKAAKSGKHSQFDFFEL